MSTLTRGSLVRFNTHITASFRDATSYGQFTTKQLKARQTSKVSTISHRRNEHSPFIQVTIRWIINVLFFTIPWTYLAHVKSSSEFRGRLNNVQQNWEEYIKRLVREYSDFLLIVSLDTSSFYNISGSSPGIDTSPLYFFRKQSMVSHVHISI